MIPWSRITLLVSVTFLFFGLVGLFGPDNKFVSPVVFHQPIYLAYSLLMLVFVERGKLLSASMTLLFAIGTLLDPLWRTYMEWQEYSSDWPHYAALILTVVWGVLMVRRLFLKDFGRLTIVHGLATMALMVGLISAQFSSDATGLMALSAGAYLFYFLDGLKRDEMEKDLALHQFWLLVANLELMKIISFT